MAHCCPPNAEKFLAPDYTAIGKIQTLPDDNEFYHVGEPGSKKAVIVLPDIFGWNGGRTRNIADYFAENGYYAVVAKIMVPGVGGIDGDGFLEIGTMESFFANLNAHYTWDKIEPRVQSLTAHVKATGAEKISMVGFCWGGWVGCKVLASPAYNDFTCLAIGHPSVHLEEYAFKKSTQELFDAVQKPLLLQPARGDSDAYRTGGPWFESVKSRLPSSQSIDYADFDHGFIPRSDISVPANKDAVDKALSEILAFFNEHSN